MEIGVLALQGDFAEHCDALAFGDLHLIEDFAGGCNGLDKNRVLGGDGFRHAVQVVDGQSQEFAKRSGLFDDPEHRASRTFGRRRGILGNSAGVGLSAAAGQWADR